MKNNYKDFATALAEKAGKITVENFQLGMSKGWKEDSTPLTVTDTAINSLVIDSVKKEFPGHGVLGEEESLQGNSECVWVCDPLDGTIPFSHGIPTSCFSLALTKNGEPILGVIYEPFGDRLYLAEKGKGATLNDKNVRISGKKDLVQTVIDLEWAWHFRFNLSGLREELMKRKSIVLALGSVVFGGSQVVNGEFSAAIFGNYTPWDAAALKVITEEAGGKLTDLFGKDQLYNKETEGFIASNGLVHDELVGIVKQVLETNTPKT